MKRFFDLAAGLLLLIILLPVFAVIAAVIIIDDGRPVIFKQKRVGMNNELFSIYKFRTMKNGTRNAATGDLSESGDSITKSGRLLRKASLDELPQLFNIIKGDMSFVGPRPLIPEETEIRQLRLDYGVYAVKPGMTGLAQVNGRDNLDDKQKAVYDKEYVENHNLWMDIKIMFKTVFVVLTGKNVVEGKENADGR